jgi:hypothetical protein
MKKTMFHLVMNKKKFLFNQERRKYHSRDAMKNKEIVITWTASSDEWGRARGWTNRANCMPDVDNKSTVHGIWNVEGVNTTSQTVSAHNCFFKSVRCQKIKKIQPAYAY